MDTVWRESESDLEQLHQYIDQGRTVVAEHDRGMLVPKDVRELVPDANLGVIRADLPGGLNLPAAVLAHLVDVMESHRWPSSRLRNRFNHLHNTLNFAVSAQNHDRRDVDPEVYAENVKQKARAQVDIRDRFDEMVSVLIDALPPSDTPDRFIQPIDMGLTFDSEVRRIRYFDSNLHYQPVIFVQHLSSHDPRHPGSPLP